MKPWDAAQEAHLAALWATGMSAGRIGHEMRRSKNSIIGRAHRMKLPGRRSCIVRDPNGPARPYRERKPDAVVARKVLRRILKPIAAPAEAAPAPLPVVVPMKRRSRASEPCCWPMTNGAPWRYCDEPSVNGTVYCATHWALAYRRREAA